MFNSNNTPFTMPVMPATGGYSDGGAWGDGGWLWIIVVFALLFGYMIALPVILTAFMGYIVWLLKKQKRDRDANSKGTMLLLRVQLIEYHDKYMALGEIPSYVYDNFNEMYDAYHKLGGNGMATKMKQEIDELHLKKAGK